MGKKVAAFPVRAATLSGASEQTGTARRPWGAMATVSLRDAGIKIQWLGAIEVARVVCDCRRAARCVPKPKGSPLYEQPAFGAR
jgi:hypothetical protein